MNSIFVYVLEVLLTLDKMEITSRLMSTRFEFCGQSILKVNQVFDTVCIVLYIGCSGPVVECLMKVI